MRPGYRVRQFLAALSFEGPVEEAALKAYLSPAQVELFRSMPGSEQRHALAVQQTLQQQGHADTVVVLAALLHDAGKALQGVRLWHRVAVVLLEATRPALLERLALDEPGSWRYPFHVLLHHAARGAEMAAAAGTDPLAVELIRWHHTEPRDSGLEPRAQALLSALRFADEEH